MKKSLVVKNGVINLVYQIFPVIAGLIMIPITIEKLGKEFFSIYTLGVTIIVLFNYLNFGIGVSVTKEFSKYFGEKQAIKKKSYIFNSALFVTLLLSIILVIIGLLLTPYLARALVSETSSEYYQKFAFHTFWWISISSPIFLLVILFRGCLEGFQVFKITSLNRAYLNSMIFLMPGLAILGISTKYGLIQLICIAYFISMINLFYQTHQKLEVSIKPSHIEFSIVKKLLISGGWMTIVSTSAIVFYYSDRFFIGTLIGLIPLSYYVVSYDLVSKLNMISGSLSASVYPAVSNWKNSNKFDLISSTLYLYGKTIALIMFTFCLIFTIFSKEFLKIWINYEFAQKSSIVLAILSVSLFFNSMSSTLLRTLCGLNQEKKIALMYLSLAIPYTILLIYSIKNFGITGAAFADLFRTVCEYFLLHMLVFKGFELKRQTELSKFLLIVPIFYATILLSTLFLDINFYIKLCIYIVIVIFIIFLNYVKIFSVHEKNRLVALLGLK